MHIIDNLVNLDKDLFLILNELHNSVLDFLMAHISAKLTWIPLYLGVTVFIFYKFKLKKGIVIVISFIILITFTDQTSVHLFKNVFQRLRPCFDIEIMHIVHYIDIPGSKYGFVSSHAANSFGFAFLSLLLFRNKTYTILILFWAFIVSYSRIYLGVHFPGDVLGGALLGISIAILIYIILKRLIDKKN